MSISFQASPVRTVTQASPASADGPDPLAHPEMLDRPAVSDHPAKSVLLVSAIS